MIAALFVTEDSIYKKLGVDSYDIIRDAKTCISGSAAVCHPPCRAWGKFSWRAKPRPGERDLAPWSITYVRMNGGVVEHPDSSALWHHIGAQRGVIDQWGGYIITLDQWVFGHKANKRTTLYICGCPPEDLPRIPKRKGEPTHIVTRDLTKGSRKPEISKKERMETPPPFAKWLIKVAEICEKNKSVKKL